MNRAGYLLCLVHSFMERIKLMITGEMERLIA